MSVTRSHRQTPHSHEDHRPIEVIVTPLDEYPELSHGQRHITRSPLAAAQEWRDALRPDRLMRIDETAAELRRVAAGVGRYAANRAAAKTVGLLGIQPIYPGEWPGMGRAITEITPTETPWARQTTVPIPIVPGAVVRSPISSGPDEHCGFGDLAHIPSQL